MHYPRSYLCDPIETHAESAAETPGALSVETAAARYETQCDAAHKALTAGSITRKEATARMDRAWFHAQRDCVSPAGLVAFFNGR